MRPLAVLASLGLLITPALSQEPPDAAEIGAIFCAASLVGDMAPVQDLLTPDLAETIAAALARNDEIQAANPDEKPPLGDGIPWSTWPDHPDSCAVVEVDPKSIYTRVIIEYGFSAAPAATYRDNLIVSPHRPDFSKPKAWRIDDIELEGTTLRAVMDTAFDP